ncbi:putative toxin-antitoxin system toxin component, PIN family [Acidobacteriota bacterium]
MKQHIVIDTSVLISALLSRRGASYLLLSLIDDKRFDIHLSVPLVIEYESVAKRKSRSIGLTHAEIDDIIDYLCSVGRAHRVHFLWRPFLRDPGDDLVLEVAVEAECEYIVTHNVRHFAEVDRFGVKVVTPAEFLRIIGAIP